MKIIRLLLLCIMFLTSMSGLRAQKDNCPLGARSAALGNASVTLNDFWSVHNNQAGMAFYNEMAVGVYGENRFLMKELTQGAIAFILPVKKAGVFGLNYNFFGYSQYNESKVGLAYAMAFSNKISGGVQLDYIRSYIAENYGSTNIFTFELSLQAKIIKNLVFGVHVFNPIHVKMSKYSDERVPVIFRAGLSYSFSDKALIAIETEKDINQKAQFRMGVEYHLVKPVYLRIGIGTSPFTNSFGVGLEFGNFKADISASRHQVLGFSPQISMVYSFKKKLKVE
jgi:hypothetical protein